MFLILILIVYIMIGIMLELYFDLSARFWRLYTGLLFLIGILTIIDWLSLVF